MEITSNYSIVNLFANNKIVKIFCEEGIIELNLQPVGKFYTDEKWATCYTIITNEEKRESLLPKNKHSDQLSEVKTFIFDLGPYIQYKKIAMMVRDKLPMFIKNLDINFSKKELIANGITITSDI